MIKINNDLKKLRLTIDNIDTKIVSLISERIETVKQVGEIKKHKKNFYVPEREKNIFKSLSEEFPHMDKNIIKSIFAEIISGCRSFEKTFDVGVLENTYSLSALRNILGSFTNNYIFENAHALEKKYNSLDYALFSLDVNSISLVEKLQDIFIINYCIYENMRFFLFGKTENSDIVSGKAGFLLKKNNFAKIEDRLYNLSYNIEDFSNEYIFLEIDFNENNSIEEIKNILSVPHKYLGIYPNNNF